MCMCVGVMSSHLMPCLIVVCHAVRTFPCIAIINVCCLMLLFDDDDDDVMICVVIVCCGTCVLNLVSVVCVCVICAACCVLCGVSFVL